MKFRNALILSLITLLAACEGFHFDTKNTMECNKLPDSERKRCLDKGMTWEEYEKARNEVLNEPRD